VIPDIIADDEPEPEPGPAAPAQDLPAPPLPPAPPLVPRGAGPAAPESSVSLIKAFAAIAKESERAGDNAVSEVFAALEVSEDDAHPPGRPPRPGVPVPLPEHDQTLPDTVRRFSPAATALLAAGALLVILYLLLG
jgi:hypothetical protein